MFKTNLPDIVKSIREWRMGRLYWQKCSGVGVKAANVLIPSSNTIVRQ